MWLIFLLLSIVTFSSVEIPLSDKIFLHIEPVIISVMWYIVYLRIFSGHTNIIGSQEKVIDKKLIGSLFFFITVIFLTTLFNVGTNGLKNTIVSILYLLQFTTYMSVMFLIPFYLNSEKDIANCLKFIFLCYLFISLISLKMLLSGEQFQSGIYISGNIYVDPVKYQGQSFRRLSGFWSDNANTFGTYIGYSILFYFYLFSLQRKFIIRILLFCIIFLSFALLVFTFSRESLLALISGAIVFIMFSRKKISLILISTIIVTLFYIFVPDVNSFIDRLWNRSLGGLINGVPLTEINPRILIWISILRELFNEYHFFYGYGFNTAMTDNLYLSILHSSGFFGLVTFLYFIINILRKILINIQMGKNKRMGITVLSMFIFFLVQNVFATYSSNEKILIPFFTFLALYFTSLRYEEFQCPKFEYLKQ